MKPFVSIVAVFLFALIVGGVIGWIVDWHTEKICRVEPSHIDCWWETK